MSIIFWFAAIWLTVIAFGIAAVFPPLPVALGHYIAASCYLGLLIALPIVAVGIGWHVARQRWGRKSP